jgi:hypothetical protein
MTRSIILSRRFAIPILLSALFVTYPAWSGPGNKPSVEKPAGNVVMGKGDNKVEDRDGEKTGKKDGSKKDGDSVKKKAVKKAGTAAAAGVATKKVTSTIKK